jgi:avirulence D protein (AvrD)
MLRLPSTEAYLGPAESRFFGAGYRRSTHSLTDVVVASRQDGTGSVSATAAVTYPEDWSRKGTTNQPPHLSTIDVIVLGGQLIGLYLRTAYGLSPSDSQITALDHLRISAGSAPVEHELTSFPVEMSAGSSTDTAHPSCVCTTFDCTIANLCLIVSVRHPCAEQRSGTVVVAPTGLAPCSFATGWADRDNTATDLAIDRDSLTAAGQAWITPPPLWCPRPQDLVVDAFVVTLEVGQILLYELDQLDRADSNTLWMRQTEIGWGSPSYGRNSAAMTTTISKPRILDRGEERWRVADICGDVYGVTVRCAIAHRLP